MKLKLVIVALLLFSAAMIYFDMAWAGFGALAGYIAGRDLF